jgi:dipeptidyl aminopeptidase/acylaminoacyl peptidase
MYEATGKFPKFPEGYGQAPSNEDFLAMRNCSPIVHAKNIRTPYMLLVGEKDLRVVPHFAGFIRCLQANGTPSKSVLAI